MALGPKTKRFLAARRNPGETVFNFLGDLEGMATEIAKTAVDKAIDGLREELDAQVKDAYTAAMKRIGELPDELGAQIKDMMKKRLDALPHLKGDDGYTPQKGVDYNDGEPGDPGYTPLPGIDYPTIASIEEHIREYAAQYTQDLEQRGLTKKAIVEDLKKNGLDPKSIARSLETLRGADRFDYDALKNRPGTPVTETAAGGRHTLHRGGTSKQTYYYDLSDLCDGNTKIFTIPSNTRVVAVFCTDAPSGTLRPLVDWTGSATTTLTLTNQVAAPSQGATLYILYVSV